MESRSPSPVSASPVPTMGSAQQVQLQNAPQHQSKRDKRRTALSERLVTLTNNFHNPPNPRSREQQYRTQLSSLQADIQLISRADMSGQDLQLLDDSPEAIQKEVQDLFAQSGVGWDMLADQGMAGKLYAEFLEEINDAKETRDTDLTLLYQTHSAKARSIGLQHVRSLVLAREEHRSLAITIQSRVSTRLKNQLKKIANEKETSSISSLGTGNAFDINDTNALHLHPSQYGPSIGIGSPRRHGARDFYDDDMEKETNTRRKARRRGEVEDLIGFGNGMNYDSPNTNGKRKRRNHDLDDIPTPSGLDTGSPALGGVEFGQLSEENALNSAATTKHREELLKQVYTPAYSLDKLFTEKELQHHGHMATLSTIRYFNERYNEYSINGLENGGLDNDAQRNGADNDHPGTGGNTPSPDEHDDDIGRGASPFGDFSYTRGMPPLPGVTTRSNPPKSGRDGDNLAVVGVPLVGMTYVNKSGIAPNLPPARAEDVDADLAIINKAIAAAQGPSTGGGGGGNKKQRKN